jgi:DNA gyrase subunit B
MNNEIQVLSQVEAVRRNPGMYIGSVSYEGAHQLLLELVHNALDEALLGFCDRILVRIGRDFVEVQDNGRGIPIHLHPSEGISSCEVALTRLHAGSKFEKGPNEFTAGLHGVGLSCVNALSSQLKVTVDRHGLRYEQEYARGIACYPLRETGGSETSGTTVRFWPDNLIFKEFVGFREENCRDFLATLAWLNPDVEIRLENEIRGTSETFNSQGGVKSLFKSKLLEKRQLFEENLTIELSSAVFKMDAYFTWTTQSDSQIFSYVNCVNTSGGGTHVNAFRVGLVHALNHLARESGSSAWKGSPIEIDEATEGMVAVLDCKMIYPNFDGQTKNRLTNSDIVEGIEAATIAQVLAFFRSHPGETTVLFERISASRNSRIAARRIADRIYLQHARRGIDEEVYKAQFGARSTNWHDSAAWITDSDLLKLHADQCEVGGGEAIALDVCCGSGVVGASFKHKVKKVVGLDLTPQMIELAKQRLDEVHQGNVYHIPFEAQTFDLVCTREVLHLLPYPEKPVSEIFRVLKPNGQFIVGQILPFGEEDAAWMYRVFKKKQPLVYNMFQEEDFRKMLVSAGFVDIKMTEVKVWESIDVWINSVETTMIHRHEIRELFYNAPPEARAIHPFKILPNGEIHDLWRWCVFSVRKPAF